MAHEVYQIDGKDSMAYTNQVPWHGLGQKLSADADIQTWIKEAKLEWNIKSGHVMYLDDNDEAWVYEDQKVLFRDDTKAPLSTVHSSYKIVQPREVVEFFKEFVEKRQMTLETAGSLMGGKRIWALAKINHDFSLGGKGKKRDAVKPYVLMVTSCDKSLSSSARLTYVRVVCNNTLQAAYGDNSDMVKVSHRTKFDKAKQKEVQQELGIVEEQIEETEKKYNAMASSSIKKEDAVGFFLSLFEKEKKNEFDFSNVSPRKIKQLYDAYQNAPGQDLPSAKGTLWGAVNAVSYVVDHNPSARNDDTRLNNAWFGQGQTMKQKAVEVAESVIEKRTNSKLLESIIDRSKSKNQIDNIMNMVSI